MLYLLAGLPCSGKSTYAAGLESEGVVRVNVDDMMVKAHGRLGINYEKAEHLDLLVPMIADAIEQVRRLLIAGSDVVLDHGLCRVAERDRLKRVADRTGADWTLLRFDIDPETARARNSERDPAITTVFNSAALEFLLATYEKPRGEGEVAIDSL